MRIVIGTLLAVAVSPAQTFIVDAGNGPGTFWLDPVVHVFHTIGVQQPGAPVSGAVNVPTSAWFLGTRVDWQAACFGPATGTQASNAVAGLVR